MLVLLVWKGIDCTVDPYADQDKDSGTLMSLHGRVMMNEQVEEHELEEELWVQIYYYSVAAEVLVLADHTCAAVLQELCGPYLHV